MEPASRHVTGAPVLDSHGELIGLISTLRDDSERTWLKNELRMTELQEETVALLGARALRSTPSDLHIVLTEVVESTRRMLQGDCAVLFETVPGNDGFTVRAATSEIDLRVIPTGSRSLAGYTALAAKIVVVDDVRRDRRVRPHSGVDRAWCRLRHRRPRLRDRRRHRRPARGGVDNSASSTSPPVTLSRAWPSAVGMALSPP